MNHSGRRLEPLWDAAEYHIESKYATLSTMPKS